MSYHLDRRIRTNMTSKGQVLIPKDVREALGMVPGAPVEIGVNELGQATVTPGDRQLSETPDQRAARIMAALRRIQARHRDERSTEEIMRDLRGDEPLP